MKLYIETTVPNFLFATDAPEKRRISAGKNQSGELGIRAVFD